MKRRIMSLSLLAALTLALSLAAVVSEHASAQCSNAFGASVPCPGTDKQKKPTPTDTRVPRSTSTPVAACVNSTPDAAQLQTLCAGLLPAGGAGGTSQQPPSPYANTPVGGNGGSNQQPTIPWAAFGEGGLGGLLFGLIIAVLFPGLRNLYTGTTRGGGGAGKVTLTNNSMGNNTLQNPWGDSAKQFWKSWDAAEKSAPSGQNAGGTADGSQGSLTAEQRSLSEFNKGTDSNITDGTISGSGG